MKLALRNIHGITAFYACFNNILIISCKIWNHLSGKPPIMMQYTGIFICFCSVENLLCTLSWIAYAEVFKVQEDLLCWTLRRLIVKLNVSSSKLRQFVYRTLFQWMKTFFGEIQPTILIFINRYTDHQNHPLFTFTEEITKRYSNDDAYDKEFILSQAATEQCKIIRLREVK